MDKIKIEQFYIKWQTTLSPRIEGYNHSDGFARTFDNVSRMCYIAFYEGISLKEN